jgi:hypothetical protein
VDAQGLWRGNVAGLLLVMPYTAIQFVVLHEFKTLAAENGHTGGLHNDQPCNLEVASLPYFDNTYEEDEI